MDERHKPGGCRQHVPGVLWGVLQPRRHAHHCTRLHRQALCGVLIHVLLPAASMALQCQKMFRQLGQSHACFCTGPTGALHLWAHAGLQAGGNSAGLEPQQPAAASTWVPRLASGGHFRRVTCVAWGVDGSCVASASQDQTARIFCAVPVHAKGAAQLQEEARTTHWREVARPQVRDARRDQRWARELALAHAVFSAGLPVPFRQSAACSCTVGLLLRHRMPYLCCRSMATTSHALRSCPSRQPLQPPVAPLAAAAGARRMRHQHALRHRSCTSLAQRRRF